MNLVGGVAFFVVAFATPTFRNWKDHQAVQWAAAVLLVVHCPQDSRSA